MSTTTSTTSDPASVARAHKRMAFVALANHMLDHGFNVPEDTSDGLRPENPLRVRVSREEGPAWRESIHVDFEESGPAAFGSSLICHRIEGRLPWSMGFRIVLVYFSDAADGRPSHLEAVKG